MNKKIKLLLRVVVVVFILTLIVQISQARLSVIPYRIDLDINLGTTVQRKVQVWNSSDEPRLIETSVRGARSTPTGSPIWLSSEGKGPQGELYEYGALGSLVEIEPREAVAPANSSVKFTVRINAPKEYVPGSPAGRAGGLFFNTTPVKDSAQEGSLINYTSQIVTLLLIRFKSHQQPQARLMETEVKQPEPSRLRFSTMLVNTGNVHLYSRGRVIIRKANSNEKVADLVIPTRTALPKCERYYYADWRYQKAPSGTYQAKYFVTYKGDEKPELINTITFEMVDGQLKGYKEK